MTLKQIRISGTLALGWVALLLLLVVNKPEDLGYEGEDTVANAMKKKEKGKAAHCYHGTNNMVLFLFVFNTLPLHSSYRSNF